MSWPPRKGEKNVGAALGASELGLLAGTRTVLLSFAFVVGDASPSELRASFSRALRGAIYQLWSEGAVDVCEAEEIRRCVVEESRR